MEGRVYYMGWDLFNIRMEHFYNIKRGCKHVGLLFAQIILQ